MSFTLVTLTGTLLREPSTPIVGATIAVILSDAINDGVSEITPLPQATISQSDGTFSLAVEANDDVTTVPAGTSYHVTIDESEGVRLDEWDVVVPRMTAPSVDLFALTRIEN